MKKFIGIIATALIIITFIGCDNKEEHYENTISRATALSYERQDPEDCYFSSDGKTFYRVTYRDESGREACTQSWIVKN